MGSLRTWRSPPRPWWASIGAGPSPVSSGSPCRIPTARSCRLVSPTELDLPKLLLAFLAAGRPSSVLFRSWLWRWLLSRDGTGVPGRRRRRVRARRDQRRGRRMSNRRKRNARPAPGPAATAIRGPRRRPHASRVPRLVASLHASRARRRCPAADAITAAWFRPVAGAAIAPICCASGPTGRRGVPEPLRRFAAALAAGGPLRLPPPAVRPQGGLFGPPRVGFRADVDAASADGDHPGRRPHPRLAGARGRIRPVPAAGLVGADRRGVPGSVRAARESPPFPADRHQPRRIPRDQSVRPPGRAVLDHRLLGRTRGRPRPFTWRGSRRSRTAASPVRACVEGSGRFP